MQIKPQTLMVAIRCVAAQTKLLDRDLNENNPANAAELEQLLVSLDLAASDLKTAYREALEKFGELPPYEELIS